MKLIPFFVENCTYMYMLDCLSNNKYVSNKLHANNFFNNFISCIIGLIMFSVNLHPFWINYKLALSMFGYFNPFYE